MDEQLSLSNMDEQSLYETFLGEPKRYKLVNIDINSRYYDKCLVYELFEGDESKGIPKEKLYCKMVVDRKDKTVSKVRYYYQY